MDDNVAVRAISGKGLIEEDEVEQRPEKIRAASCMKDLMLQDTAKEYFTDDAWLAAETVFDLLPGMKNENNMFHAKIYFKRLLSNRSSFF